MPPPDKYEHYLAYGATDQETFRDLRGFYDGILVPATIAAFQRQGTGGFVLSLSAADGAKPYVIDSRFPLFQQALTSAKKSHQALAAILDDPALVVTDSDPVPEAFTDQRVKDIAGRWVAFNTGYDTTENKKFDKYAARLKEDVRPEQAQQPTAILPPYFACAGTDDPWWSRSRAFFDATRAATDITCVRVVCARSVQFLGPLLADLEQPEQVTVWVSGLDEHRASAAELVNYRRAIRAASDFGHQPFALYGGFFSVLLGRDGLRGSSHGVGFSEHRSWRELQSAGAPPARYYLRRAHRYVTVDLAQALYTISPDLTACPCPHCKDLRPPIELDYHELMKHSVRCRHEEIEHWFPLEHEAAAEVLSHEFDALHGQITEAENVLPAIRKKARGSIEHLPIWAEALQADLGGSS